MATDANQLQNLPEFLLAGDEDSVRMFTENLNPSSVVKRTFNQITEGHRWNKLNSSYR